MSVTFRFSRRRDGRLRVRMVATGEQVDWFYVHLGGANFWPAGEMAPRCTVVLEDSSLDRALAQIRAAEDEELVHLADAVTHRHAALQLRAPTSVREPVVNDEWLRALVRARHHHPDALVVDELGIQEGRVRADVAVLSVDCWEGVELKGASDTLRRLPRQVEAYSATFDRCEVLTVDEHADGVCAAVPSWWRVSIAGTTGAACVLQAGSWNPNPSAFARAQMLWREGALELLKNHGLAAGMTGRRRADMWHALAAAVDPVRMRELTHGVLAARELWLADGGRSRHGQPVTGP